MVALTITICTAVVLVLVVAGIRALRRADQRIDTILREERERTEDEE
jgi:hypothetical protein